MRRAFTLLACVAWSAGAQTPAPEPAPQTPSAAERPPLKLKLDNPSSWATVAPADEKEQPSRLPGLGDTARPMPTTPSTGSRQSPFPSEPKAGY